MFSHSCNGTNIFIWWKMKCTIQLGFASLNGTLHLPPHENICTIALINIHYLYTIVSLHCFSSGTFPTVQGISKSCLRFPALPSAKNKLMILAHTFLPASCRTLGSHNVVCLFLLVKAFIYGWKSQKGLMKGIRPPGFGKFCPSLLFSGTFQAGP